MLPLFPGPTEAKKTCKTWGDVQKRYRQPDWCIYENALDGPFGCWSLCDGLVTSEDFCKGCECHEKTMVPIPSRPCLRLPRAKGAGRVKGLVASTFA